MPRETHLASMLVHARPEQLQDVAEQIGNMGLELHIASPDGKLVVTQETESSAVLGDTLTALHLLDGVLAATMVFHHCEPVEEAGEDLAAAAEPREVQQ